MNAVSSRSHAVVTLRIERTQKNESGAKVKRRAGLHCVDLAGSERYSQIIEQGRQEESKLLNTSLFALTLTISRLSKMSESGPKAHIPFRNSKLTFLLSDALMGNCKTIMIACASPSSRAYHLTESTMRFASSVRAIKTRPTKNEELDGELLDSLRAEIDHLKKQLAAGGGSELQEALHATQLLHAKHSSNWEDEIARSQSLDQIRVEMSDRLGVASWNLGSAAAWRNDTDPYLVNVCQDPLLSGRLIYVLPAGVEMSVGSDDGCAIQLDGLGIRPLMCTIVGHGSEAEIVTLVEGKEDPIGPEKDQRSLAAKEANARDAGLYHIYVNYKLVTRKTKLRHGDKIRIGQSHLFQFFSPKTGGDENPNDSSDVSSTNRFLQDLTAEGSSERLNAAKFAEQLRERVGVDATEKVFANLAKLQHLIDEANLITEELHQATDSHYIFGPHVLSSVTASNVAPELAVSLSRVPKSSDRATDDAEIPATIAAVWSQRMFTTRLEVLRDLHDAVSDRKLPWGLAGDVDPWGDLDAIPVVPVKDTADSSILSQDSYPVRDMQAGAVDELRAEVRRLQKVGEEREKLLMTQAAALTEAICQLNQMKANQALNGESQLVYTQEDGGGAAENTDEDRSPLVYSPRDAAAVQVQTFPNIRTLLPNEVHDDDSVPQEPLIGSVPQEPLVGSVPQEPLVGAVPQERLVNSFVPQVSSMPYVPTVTQISTMPSFSSVAYQPYQTYQSYQPFQPEATLVSTLLPGGYHRDNDAAHSDDPTVRDLQRQIEEVREELDRLKAPATTVMSMIPASPNSSHRLVPKTTASWTKIPSSALATPVKTFSGMEVPGTRSYMPYMAGSPSADSPVRVATMERRGVDAAQVTTLTRNPSAMHRVRTPRNLVHNAADTPAAVTTSTRKLGTMSQPVVTDVYQA